MGLAFSIQVEFIVLSTEVDSYLSEKWRTISRPAAPRLKGLILLKMKIYLFLCRQFWFWSEVCRPMWDTNLDCLALLWIRFRIGSGFNRVLGSGSGARRAKMTQKNRKSSKISSFEVLYVLFWGLKTSSVARTSFMEESKDPDQWIRSHNTAALSKWNYFCYVYDFFSGGKISSVGLGWGRSFLKKNLRYNVSKLFKFIPLPIYLITNLQARLRSSDVASSIFD